MSDRENEAIALLRKTEELILLEGTTSNKRWWLSRLYALRAEIEAFVKAGDGNKEQDDAI